LIGRSAFPDREEWEGWLATHESDEKVSGRIRKIQALEELGAEVLVISADVANHKQMQVAMNQAEKTFGQLNGVIHAAGITKESRLIQEISPTDCEKQFRPKVHGLLVLQKILQGKGLDFCLLLSSLSSVLGGLGFVAYSAANLFMDAFAHQHNRESSIRWVSVNWDGWRLQEEGLDSEMQGAQQQKDFTLPSSTMDMSNLFSSSSFGASVAELAITPQEGVQAFRILTTLFEDDQVVVSTGELQARISKWINFEVDDQQDTERVVKSFSSHPRPTLQSTYVAPITQMEQQMVDIWKEVLGIEQIGITDDFFELGGHSLLATQLIFRLRSAFQVDFPLRKLFEAPTVEGVVEALAQLWGGREIVEEIARTWQEVAELSEEETKRMIQES
jgi:acyl carrier protein